MIARQTGHVCGEFHKTHARGGLRSTSVHALRAERTRGIATINRIAA